MDDDELMGLSEEERAALADDDDADIIKALAGEGDDGDPDQAGTAGGQDDGDDGDGDDDEEAAGDEATAAASGDDAAAVAAGGEEGDGADGAVVEAASEQAEEEIPPGDFVPRLSAEAPEDYEAKLTALQAREDEATRRFNEGEIEAKDLTAELRAVAEARTDLNFAQRQAEWAARQNVEFQRQLRERDQTRFLARESSKIYSEPIMLSALDTALRQVETDPKTAGKDHLWQLEQADRVVRGLFKVPTPAVAAAEAEGDKGKRTAQARQPDLSKVPQTLGHLPAAEVSETGGGEFAHLDKLDGMALEAALAKMSPEQQDRYLLGQG